MTTALVPVSRTSVSSHAGRSAVADIPLGTAAWLAFPPDARLTFNRGDFWLGRLENGAPVAVRDDRHVLLASGTRAGKGASILIPNLCHWPGSAVIIDPKGENAVVTARRRANGSAWSRGMGQKVHILDPFGVVRTPADTFADLKASFNPLDLLRPDNPEAVDDAARIAEAMVVSEASSDPFWEESARALLKALMLHVASSHDYAQARTLMTVRRLLMEGDAEARRILAMAGRKKLPSGIVLLLKAMQKNRAYGGAVAEAGAFFERQEFSSPKVLSSILQVACTNIDFVGSPQMARCMASSSFNISNLKRSRTGETVYLCLPQRAAETHYRWLRMMTALITAQMERKRSQPASGHPVLMVLDEFPALRRMRTIENAAAQIAGFGVKIVFVCQTLAQLRDIYKDNWETLVANAGVKLFFGNDDHFTRDYVSKLVGECEVIRHTRTETWTEGESASETRGTSASRSDSGTLGQSGSASFATSGGSSTIGRSHSVTAGLTQGWSQSASVGVNRSKATGISETIHKRPLLTPDEVGRLFGDRANPRALVLLSGHQPLALRRIWYFADRVCEALFDPHPDHRAPLSLRQRETRRREKEEQERRAQEAFVRWYGEEQRRRAQEEAEKERMRPILIERGRRMMEELRREEEEQQRQALRQYRRERRREIIGNVLVPVAGGAIGLGLATAIWHFSTVWNALVLFFRLLIRDLSGIWL